MARERTRSAQATIGSGPTALITGTSGTVGHAVASACHQAGWHVVGIDKVPGPWTTTIADIRDKTAIRHAISGVDAVLHIAALHAPHVGVASAVEFRAVNVAATADLLEQAMNAGVTRFIYTSTTSVYGHSLEPADVAIWVDEHLAVSPRDVYDETKLNAESLVTSSRLDATVLRIARCFNESPSDMALHRLYRGVGVADVAAAHVLALCSASGSNTFNSNIFNIAGPLLFEQSHCADLYSDARALIQRLQPGIAASFAARNWQLPQRIDRVYDSSLAREALGYDPNEGVAELLSQP